MFWKLFEDLKQNKIILDYKLDHHVPSEILKLDKHYADVTH